MIQPPSAYIEGYWKARLIDRQTADNYIRHTAIGDPLMDAIVEELASLPQAQAGKLIRAGHAGGRGGASQCPESAA